jgi:Mg-chelatase subunit ChlD
MGLRFNARLVVGLGVLLGVPIAAACSSKSGSFSSGDGNNSSIHPTESADSDGGGGAGPFGNSSGNSNNGNPNGQFVQSTDAGTISGPSTIDAACAFSTQMGQQQGLNAYMMLDYSASMTMDNKWPGVTGAINSFIQQPTSGISVGMQYFAVANPDAGLFGLIPVVGDSCDPTLYAQPAIEIAPLPGVAAQITASLAKHNTPSTGTPTTAALQGAINHATTWAKAHPADATIVILATDGDPDECGNGSGTAILSQVEAIAAAGVAATPKILTFVIGVGTETANLNGIAMAGGTKSAFIVDTSMNISAQFLAALDKIRGAALGCQYKIPVPMTGSVDDSKVNVQFTPSGGKSELVPHVADAAHCPTTGDAWYYDNPSSPTQILLCTTTCGTVSSGGEVDVLTGCQTVEEPAK